MVAVVYINACIVYSLPYSLTFLFYSSIFPLFFLMIESPSIYIYFFLLVLLASFRSRAFCVVVLCIDYLVLLCVCGYHWIDGPALGTMREKESHLMSASAALSGARSIRAR